MVDRFKETKQLICIFDRVENGQAVFHGYQAILKANSQQVLPPVFNRHAYGVSLNFAVPEYRLSEAQLQAITPWEEYRRTRVYRYQPDMAVMLEDEKKKGLAELAQASRAHERQNSAGISVEPAPQVA